MYLKRVETESFIKSFFLFSISLGTLISIIFYINYTKEVKSLDELIFSQMRICNFDLKCEKFHLDFVKPNSSEYYVLHKQNDTLRAYFPISGAKSNALEIKYSKKDYLDAVSKIKHTLFIEYIIVVTIVLLLSFLFSLYTLSPLRSALRLTEEFIKDILHDFNTPLSTLRLNTSMLKKEIGFSERISRIENSVETVMKLQSHLRAYLNDHQKQKESFNLTHLLQERVCVIEKNFPSINFYTKLDSLNLHTNKEAFVRIIDNLLTNAAKYNKSGGEVYLLYNANKTELEIRDTGKGIKNPKKVFERFYKEQDRGIGIGLHIVKKLCDELGLVVYLKSKVGEGTSFYLDINTIIVR